MKLLIAEDDQDLAYALKRILEKHHYFVDVTHNGQDAFDYVSTSSYDGLIIDWMMPIKNGYDTIQEIRQKNYTIPIMFLTAKSDIQDKIQGLDCGADDYLPKPFHMDELLARVRALLRRRDHYIPEIVTWGDLDIDQHHMNIRYKNEIYTFSQKEFSILYYLFEHHTYPVTSQMIYDHIWGWLGEVDPNILFVYMSNLRKLLKAYRLPIEIKTYRGSGYALVMKS